jgi:hypothetical protein
LLLVSWLARELGWGPGSALGHGENRVEFASGDRRVAVYLRPVDYPAIEPGGLVSLKIVCRTDTTEALLTISRTGDPTHVTIRTEHQENAAETSVRVVPPPPHELLMDELDAAAHDPEYRRILDGIPPLARAVQSGR